MLQTVRITRDDAGKVSILATDLDSFATYTAKEAQAGPAVDILVPLDQLAKTVKCSSPKEDIGICSGIQGKGEAPLQHRRQHGGADHQPPCPWTNIPPVA